MLFQVNVAFYVCDGESLEHTKRWPISSAYYGSLHRQYTGEGILQSVKLLFGDLVRRVHARTHLTGSLPRQYRSAGSRTGTGALEESQLTETTMGDCS